MHMYIYIVIYCIYFTICECFKILMTCFDEKENVAVKT